MPQPAVGAEEEDKEGQAAGEAEMQLAGPDELLAPEEDDLDYPAYLRRQKLRERA